MMINIQQCRGCMTLRSPPAPAPQRLGLTSSSRAQLAALLHRLAGEPTASGHPFVDVVAGWQQQPVAWMVANEITTGTSPTTFAPNEPVTRGQLATFLYRYKGSPEVTIDPHSPQCEAFTALDSGNQHSCAIRSNGAAACWGAHYGGQTEPPNGILKTISAGARHTCGLRTDNAITCWGDTTHLQADAPTGQFTSVSAGSNHTCGLRTNQTITCWGANWNGQTDAPDGQFTSVSTGSNYTCGLRTNQTITCWGANDYTKHFTSVRMAGCTHALYGPTTPSPAGAQTGTAKPNTYRPVYQRRCPGPHLRVADRQHHHLLGKQHTPQSRSTNGTVHRRQHRWGSFMRVTRRHHHCLLGSRLVHSYHPIERAIHRNQRWTTNTHARYAPTKPSPAGALATSRTNMIPSAPAVSGGWSHACALRTDGTITCWGENNYGQTNSPNGQFTAISSGTIHNCALRSDNTITCWGRQTDAPEGQFNSISAGHDHTCALRSDNTVTCWGDNTQHQTDAPEGQFNSKISAGKFHNCALRSDNTVACWGANWTGQNNAPDGQFTSISAGRVHTCARRIDSTVTCWGDPRNSQAQAGSFAAVKHVAFMHTFVLEWGD